MQEQETPANLQLGAIFSRSSQLFIFYSAISLHINLPTERLIFKKKTKIMASRICKQNWTTSVLKISNAKISGPVHTSDFSCTKPNVAIKYMKSSTYESIRIGRFVFGSTVPFYPTGLVG